MKTSVARGFVIVALATIALSCSENSLGVRHGGLAAVRLQPSFAQGPGGGPRINIARLTAVLRHGVDSLFAEAIILGDSGILEFQRVPVTGDSTIYGLGLQAFDSAHVLVFSGDHLIHVYSGANPPVSAVLQYSAPDTAVASVSVSPNPVVLDYAGADANDNTCLTKVTKTTPHTSQQLTATGKSSAGQEIAGVRVGWTSRDTTVARVDEQGVVRARCAAKSTWVVARTFLDKVDSTKVTVEAPAFALRMSPESTTVARTRTVQLAALLVDESGNTSPTTGPVTWTSSDASRATVSATGLVTGVANGRVLITARSGDRSAIGIVQVVRPTASKVVILPRGDTALIGQYRTFFARAYDAQNRVIPDANAFEWLSKNTSVATVNAGTAKAVALGSTYLFAKVDGVKDSVPFVVASSLPSGAVQGVIRDGATDLGLTGARIAGPSDTVFTDPNGVFVLGGLHSGDNVTVTKDGYVAVTVYNVPVYSNDTVRIPPAPLAPFTGSTGTMSGKVVNALNGQGAAGITIKAYAGVNAAPSPQRPDVTPSYSAVSASDGSYTMAGVAPGAYTFVASGTGYSETNSVGIALGGTTRDNGTIILPPSATSGSMYVVLTWGSCGTVGVPCDLDAHLTGPQISTDTAQRFHVYKDTVAYIAGDTIAALDVSDASGPGPEVISIRAGAQPGRFRFSVYDVTNAANASSLALSQTANARVDLYMNNRVVATFFPPTNQPGNLWQVFEWDGARLTQLGQIVYQAAAGNVP